MNIQSIGQNQNRHQNFGMAFSKEAKNALKGSIGQTVNATDVLHLVQRAAPNPDFHIGTAVEDNVKGTIIVEVINDSELREVPNTFRPGTGYDSSRKAQVEQAEVLRLAKTDGILDEMDKLAVDFGQF